jgi:uncharacterized protein involved in exopolysaccharide biosynthesis
MQNGQLSWRHCVLLLASRWRLILLAGFVFGVLGGLIGLVLLYTSPVYESQALLLVSKPRYYIELESKIKSNPDPIASTAMTMASLNARLQTLALLAISPEVGEGVKKRLGSHLPEQDRETAKLMGRVKVRPTNEVLRITASAPTREGAAELANAWAEEVATRVEAIYAASAGTEAIDTEVENARLQSQAAERAVSQFSIDNPVDDLARRVQAKTDEIRVLQDHRLHYLRGRAATLYHSLGGIDQAIRDAETLRQQLEEPTHSQAAAAGDALALMMLRARVYLPQPIPMAPETTPTDGRNQNADGTTPTRQAPAAVPSAPANNVQLTTNTLNFPTDRAQDRVQDLDAMMQALRSRRAEVQAEFEALARRLDTSLYPANGAVAVDDDRIEVALSQAVNELQKMKAELAALTRQREELVNQRNVYTTSYQTLLNKGQELRVLKATTGGEGVIVAERATPPNRPMSPRPAVNTGIGILIGLLVGCALALRPVLRGWLSSGLRAEPHEPPGSKDEPRPRTALIQPR